MNRSIKASIFTAAIVLSVALALFKLSAVRAVTGSNFNPGLIISDSVFYNSMTMDVDEIQTFLEDMVNSNGQPDGVPGECDGDGSEFYGVITRAQYSINHPNGTPPPFVCLPDYYENPDTGENNYWAYINGDFINTGGAIPSGAISAAQIIYNVAQYYGINPQVLIVLLQKEQSLIADEWPWGIQYQKATGYGCPDSAPCNEEYYGFYNQVRKAAYQFIRYRSFPGNYNFIAGQNNTILYNPNAACGSSSVYIQNQATAGLYNYTPYQPNSAALNSLYNNGDSCSSYGNRNFWRIFNDWFGDSVRSLVSANGGTYLIQNGTKRIFPNEETFLSYSYKWADVVAITPTELALIPDGAVMQYNVNFREGRLISAPGQGVYLVENGLKRPISSVIAFLSYSYKWADVVTVTPVELTLIPDGATMDYNVSFREGKLLTTALSGGIYLIENGLKRPFPSSITFLSYSYKWTDVVTVTPAEFALIPYGAVMEYNVNFREGKLLTTTTLKGGIYLIESGIYLVENGLKRPFPDSLIFLSYSYKWADVVTVNPVEFALIPDGATMDYNVSFREGKLLTTALGGGIHLVDNGLKRPFPSSITFLSYSYKWADVVTITPAELALIPDGAVMQYNNSFREGKLITSAPSGGIYLVDNGLKRPFPDSLTFLSYFYKWKDVVAITPTELTLIPDGATMDDNVSFREGRLISAPGQGVYLVENGLKRPISSVIAFLSYSYKWADVVTVTPVELTLIPDGATMDYNVSFREGKLLTTALGGGIYLIENGLKRPFPNEAIFLSYSYKWKDVVAITPTELALIPDGATMELKTP